MANETEQPTRQPRRCLVLAGGGAKGAYAYGCLKVFNERGIHFESVAGTSVGALNAALWSTSAFEIGDALWKGLSFDTVLPFRIRRWKRIWPINYLVGFAIVLTSLLLASWAATPHPAKRVCAAINAVLLAALILFIGLVMPPMGFDPFKFTLLTVAVALAVTELYASQVQGDPGLHDATKFLVSGAVATLVFCPALYFLLSPLLNRLGDGPALFLGLAITPVAVGTWAFGRLIESIERWAATSVGKPILENSQLSVHITGILQSRPCTIPTFACAAERKQMFDYWYHMQNMVGVHRVRQLRNKYVSRLTNRWIPRYVDIQCLPIEDARDLLIASAALPFGLLPSVAINGHDLVDGGIADNRPIFPLLDSHVDELFLVVLKPEREKTWEEWVAHLSKEWSDTDLLCRRADLKLPPDSIDDWTVSEWKHLILQARPSPPIPPVVLFQPSEPLGGFLRGTLNFHGSYSRRLMLLGRRDAEQRLDQYSKQDSSSSSATRN
jgi:hypothetical protein